MMGFVYIIALETPLGNALHSAKYYVGWAQNIEKRFWYHETGQGAAFTRAAAERGISMKIIWQAPGTKQDERRIKNMKNTKRFLLSQGIALA